MLDPKTLLLVGLCACGGTSPDPAGADPGAPLAPATPVVLPLDAPDGLGRAVGQPVRIEARDLVLRVEGAEVRVPYLAGSLAPVNGGGLVDLESPRSFEVTIDALEVRIPEQTLRHALVDGPAGAAPFRDLVVRTEGESLQIEGHTGPLNLPFSFRADPAVTPRGALGLRLEKVRLLGIGVKGFLGALHAPIEKAANKRGRLVQFDEDWLVIDPFPTVGPPEIHARFTAVEVRDHEIVARLGALTPRQEGDLASGVVLEGGVLRTGQTVLFDTTLHLVALDGGALVIDPSTFADQLAGGFTQTVRPGRIIAYVLAPGQPSVDPTETPRSGPAEPHTPPEIPAPAAG